MTNASPPSFDPDLFNQVRALEVRARTLVEGVLAGRHRSPFRGGSSDFAQHRPYAPGDDLRHLDWKVWAKSDRLYVREFEDDTNLQAMLVLDTSPSMSYGDGPTQKQQFARSLVAALAYLLLKQADSVGLTDARGVAVPIRQGESHLRTILTGLCQPYPPKPASLDEQLALAAQQTPRRGFVAVASDLLVDRSQLMQNLRALREKKQDVVVFQVLHTDEVDFPFEGNTRFEGLETNDQITCDPRSLRDSYLKAMRSFIDDCQRRCQSVGVDHRLCITRDGVEVVLSELLRERMRG